MFLYVNCIILSLMVMPGLCDRLLCSHIWLPCCLVCPLFHLRWSHLIRLNKRKECDSRSDIVLFIYMLLLIAINSVALVDITSLSLSGSLMNMPRQRVKCGTFVHDYPYVMGTSPFGVHRFSAVEYLDSLTQCRQHMVQFLMWLSSPYFTVYSDSSLLL